MSSFTDHCTKKGTWETSYQKRQALSDHRDTYMRHVQAYDF